MSGPRPASVPSEIAAMRHKRLWMTTDFMDDLFVAGRHFDKGELDAMMAWSASLGTECHQWILDTIWTLYDDDGPAGFDLLAEACDAAHRHGMRFHVIYKPFEGGLDHLRVILPTTLPRFEGDLTLDEIRGRMYAVRPFVAANPHLRIERRAADRDPGGRITAIRLIKDDDKASPFTLDDISILTSDRNGGYLPYGGPIDWSEHLGWRPRFPWRDTPSRVVTLGGLDLPRSATYLLVRCRRSGAPAGFANAVENLVELVNERGQVIPSTPCVRRADTEGMWARLKRTVDLDLGRHTRRADVRPLLRDRDWFLEQWRDAHSFDAGWEDVDFLSAKELAVARGKARHNAAALHPIYPQVREHWLREVQFCIDRGVDAVNFRTAHHARPYEPWAYGFNQPVLDQMTDPGNIAEARRINGSAYTQFLREARDLLHRHGRQMGVHVHSLMLRHDDRAANSLQFPGNFEWQWETWIRELVDFAEYRGATYLRPENQREVMDRFGLVAREAGKPLIYQSIRGAVGHFQGPHPALAWEMDWVRQHRDVAGYNLYETADFTRLLPDGRFEGSPDVAALLQEHWRA